MTNKLLIFIPQKQCTKQSGYIFGKVVHNTQSDLNKIYIIGVRKLNAVESAKSTLSTIGYYSDTNNTTKIQSLDRKHSDWIYIVVKCYEDESRDEYRVTNVIINNKRLDSSTIRITIVLYDQRALQETELFESKAASGDHFYELAKLIQSKKDELRVKSRFVLIKETLLIYHMVFYLYPVLSLSKVVEKLLPILKYSSLGLHVYSWLENIKWMLITVIRNKSFTLKTGNYALAIAIDMTLGIFVLRLLRYYIEDAPPSQVLLNNAEASLKYAVFIKMTICVCGGSFTFPSKNLMYPQLKIFDSEI